MKLRKLAVATSVALALSLLTAIPAEARMTPGPIASESSSDAVGLIVKYKPAVKPIAPNGEPTGENYAGVDLENSTDLGGGFKSVEFASDLDSDSAQRALEQLKLDPRVESAELNLYVQTAFRIPQPIEPLVTAKTNEPIEIPSVVTSALRKPTISSVAANVSWMTCEAPRAKIAWKKPKARYSGVIVGYRIQIYGAGKWRTIKSKTSSSARSFTASSSYLSVGNKAAFRVAALFKTRGRTYVGNYKTTYAKPVLTPSNANAPTPVGFSNNTDFSKQWYLDSSQPFSVKATDAWATESGMSSVVVAVLDTGITAHPDLPCSQLVPGFDMVSNLDGYPSNDGNGRDTDPSDPGDFTNSQPSSWHGTHVAGIIGAADNYEGIVGVAPNVKIQPIRVLTSNGGLIQDIVAGINWAIGEPVDGLVNPQPANVINLSIGGQAPCFEGQATQSALALAKSKGITVVTAAGNDNDFATLSYPGNCYPTINVGATGSDGRPTFYSNFSDANSVGVDISAPGGDVCPSSGNSGQIWATLNGGSQAPTSATWGYEMGTSMAAPIVSGTISLMYSAKLRQNPSYPLNSAFVESIWNAISTTATPFSSSAPTNCQSIAQGRPTTNGSQEGGYGVGIIDAAAAIAAIRQ